MSKIKMILGFFLILSHSNDTLAVCTVSATNIAFGNFNPFQVSPINVNGTLTVQCNVLLSVAINYTAALSAGGGGGFTPRTMLSGANTLNYNLYTTAGLTNIWGDGTAGTSTVLGGGLCILNCTFTNTIFGQLPAPQPTAHVGAYTSTITATITY
jgi:spore coat protein U-like protein